MDKSDNTTTSNENVDSDSSDCVEIIEETLIQVSVDNPDGMSHLNVNSNVRLIAVESDSPILQIENQVFHFNEWKYVQGTAMFFEQKKEVKLIDPLYDNRCGSELQYIGSTRKCLEMTKKNTTM